jgi:hypothetical protein
MRWEGCAERQLSNITSRSHMTLLCMTPLLSQIFHHHTRTCICHWDGLCQERTPSESTQKHMDVSNLILMSPSLRVLDECVVLKAFSSFASSMTVISFDQLARTVAEKSVDKETKDYCVEVALILKERHTEMTKVGKMGRLSTIDSVSQGPKEEAKPRNADSETKDSELTEFEVEYCLPTMDSISPGPKYDTKQRKVQLSRRVTHAFEDQPSRHYLSVHAPIGIFPVAQEQDNMNSRDNSRTLMMDMYHQYQHTQAATIPNTSTIWGNESLDCTHIKMRQPMPSVFVQEMIPRLSMPIMTGSTPSQTGYTTNTCSTNSLPSRMPAEGHPFQT